MKERHDARAYEIVNSDRYQALMGPPPKDIPHWEYLGSPRAETYITGIDYYAHPRQCRQRLAELYPQLNVDIPESDDPIPRPEVDGSATTVGADAEGRRVVRWGHQVTHHWDMGAALSHGRGRVCLLSPGRARFYGTATWSTPGITPARRRSTSTFAPTIPPSGATARPRALPPQRLLQDHVYVAPAHLWLGAVYGDLPGSAF